MSPGNRFLVAGAALIVFAAFLLFNVAVTYWPLQPVVQVVAPFLGISILASVGLSLILTALLTPWPASGGDGETEVGSTVDPKQPETKGRR